MVQGVPANQQNQSESVNQPDSVVITEAELSAATQPLVSSDPPLTPEEAIAQMDSILALNETSSPPFLTEDQVSDLKESKKLLENDSTVAQLAGFEKMYSTLAGIKPLQDSGKSGDLGALKNDLVSKAKLYAELKDTTISLFSNDVLIATSDLPDDDKNAALKNHADKVVDLHKKLESAGLNMEGTSIDDFVSAFESGSLDSTSALSNALADLQINVSNEMEELEIDGLNVELISEATEQAQLYKDVTNQFSNNPKSIESAVQLSNDLLTTGGLEGLTPSDVKDMKAQVNVALEARYKQLGLPSNPALWTDAQRFLADNDPTIVHLNLTNLCLADLLDAAKSGGSVSGVEAFDVMKNYMVSSATTLGNAIAKMEFYVGNQDPAYIIVRGQYNEQLAQLDSFKGLNAKALQQL